jgi:hypothetical protein
MSHTPNDAITTDSKISRDATSARALAALAGSCFMEESLTYVAHIGKKRVFQKSSQTVKVNT